MTLPLPFEKFWTTCNLRFKRDVHLKLFRVGRSYRLSSALATLDRRHFLSAMRAQMKTGLIGFQPSGSLLDDEYTGNNHRRCDGYLKIELFIQDDPSQE
jgi:hypothetical protein